MEPTCIETSPQTCAANFPIMVQCFCHLTAFFSPPPLFLYLLLRDCFILLCMCVRAHVWVWVMRLCVNLHKHMQIQRCQHHFAQKTLCSRFGSMLCVSITVLAHGLYLYSTFLIFPTTQSESHYITFTLFIQWLTEAKLPTAHQKQKLSHSYTFTFGV